MTTSTFRYRVGIKLPYSKALWQSAPRLCAQLCSVGYCLRSDWLDPPLTSTWPGDSRFHRYRFLDGSSCSGGDWSQFCLASGGSHLRLGLRQSCLVGCAWLNFGFNNAVGASGIVSLHLLGSEPGILLFACCCLGLVWCLCL